MGHVSMTTMRVEDRLSGGRDMGRTGRRERERGIEGSLAVVRRQNH